MLSQVLVVTMMAIVASAKSVDDASISREETETERIIMGRTATPGQFPWAASLFYNGQFICTSSIISPTTVMTAAHCVVFDGVSQSASDYYAIANVDKRSNSVRINFESVTPHPNYDGQSINNDVAIFKTTEAIPINDEVAPICIAAPNTPMMAYRNATAMGWGKINYSRFFNILPNRLQYVEQTIVPNALCSFVNSGVNEDKVCATGPFNGICNGDSGGPLVHLSADKRPVQIGIASYINGVAGCGKIVPGVWTRVSSFYDFIMQNAGNDGVCTI